MSENELAVSLRCIFNGPNLLSKVSSFPKTTTKKNAFFPSLGISFVDKFVSVSDCLSVGGHILVEIVKSTGAESC